MRSAVRYMTVLILCGSLDSCKKSEQRAQTSGAMQTAELIRNSSRAAPMENPAVIAQGTGTQPTPGRQDINPDKVTAAPGGAPGIVLPPDESIDPPANISGVLLYVHCSFEAFANDKSQESLLGCRIDDQAGKRRPASSLAPTFTYDYKLPAFPDLQIYPRILDRDSRYDVLYLLKGKPTIEMAQQVAKMVINAVLKGTEAEKDVVVKGVLANILRHANSLPEQRDADYIKLVEQIVSDARAGVATPIPVDPLPTDPKERGHRLYAQFCLSCHGEKGKGPEQPIRELSADGIGQALSSVLVMSQTKTMVTRDEIDAIALYLKP